MVTKEFLEIASAADIPRGDLEKVLRLLLAPADIPSPEMAFRRLQAVISDCSEEAVRLGLQRHVQAISTILTSILSHDTFFEGAIGQDWSEEKRASAIDLTDHPMHGRSLGSCCSWALLYYRLDGETDVAFRSITGTLVLNAIKASVQKLSEDSYQNFLSGKEPRPLGSWQSSFAACGLELRKLTNPKYQSLLNELGFSKDTLDLLSRCQQAIQNPGTRIDDHLEVMKRIHSFLSLVHGKRNVAYRRGHFSRTQMDQVSLRRNTATVIETDDDDIATHIHNLHLSESPETIHTNDLHPLDVASDGQSLFSLDCESSKSEFAQRLKKQQAREWHIAETNRISKWHRTTPDPSAINALIAHIHTQLDPARTKKQRYIAAIIYLELLTGQPRDILENARYRKSDEEFEEDLEFLFDSRQICVRCQQPQYAWDATDEEKAVSRPITDYVVVSVPEELWQLLDAPEPKSGEFVFSAELFENFDELLKAFVDPVPALRKLTLNQIRAPIKDAILAIRPDHATLAVLTRSMSLPAHASLHYFTPSVCDLHDIHLQAATRIGLLMPQTTNPNPANTYAGALRCPTIAHVRSCIDEQLHCLAVADSLHDFHNAFTTYTHFIISIALALRATRNSDWLAKDLKTGLIIHSDKDDGSGYHRRLMVLAETALEILREYDAYRGRLMERTPYLRSVSKNQLSYFFIFDKMGRTLPYGPQEASEHSKFKLPINALRRLVQTYMWEHGATGEEIGAVMGHWYRGRELWSDASCASPISYLTDLAKRFLQPLLIEVGASVVHAEERP